MSEYKLIDDAVHSSDNGQFKTRKKNPVAAIILFLLGAGTIILAYRLPSLSDNPNISSAVIFIGFSLVLIGVIMLISALRGKGVPYYSATGETLRRQELLYDPVHKQKVKDLVAGGDLESLADLPRGETSGVKVVIYKTASGDLIMAQVQEYVPHYYRPVDDVKVFGNNITG